MFIKIFNNCLSDTLCNSITHNNLNINKQKLLLLLNKELEINLKKYLSLVPVIKTNFMEFDDIIFKVITQPSSEFINDEFVDFFNTKYAVLSFIFCFNMQNGVIEFINGETAVLENGSLLFFPANWAYSYKFTCTNANIAHGVLYINKNKLVQNKVKNLFKTPFVPVEEAPHTCL